MATDQIKDDVHRLVELNVALKQLNANSKKIRDTIKEMEAGLSSALEQQGVTKMTIGSVTIENVEKTKNEGFTEKFFDRFALGYFKGDKKRAEAFVDDMFDSRERTVETKFHMSEPAARKRRRAD